jgi:hypothetical protein
MKLINKMLRAARADRIPEGTSGRWTVKKHTFKQDFWARNPDPDLMDEIIPAGTYTSLHCMTESTMHLIGELIMHDVPHELKTHLNFMLRARGRVLINGLGLGCVVRGVLKNPEVTHVTVIERSRDVLKLVQPYMPKTGRLIIIKADALRYAEETKEKFDCAWNDLWNDEDKEERALALIHADLMVKLRRKVQFQGAWAMPRYFRNAMNRTGKAVII